MCSSGPSKRILLLPQVFENVTYPMLIAVSTLPTGNIPCSLNPQIQSLFSVTVRHKLYLCCNTPKADTLKNCVALAVSLGKKLGKTEQFLLETRHAYGRRIMEVYTNLR